MISMLTKCSRRSSALLIFVAFLMFLQNVEAKSDFGKKYSDEIGDFSPSAQLDYCVAQTRLALKELGQGGEIDYSMMPRNILKGQKEWNCRKVSAEEWCSGFWPGILWYAYEASGDDKLKTEAEKFTSELEFLSKKPAYDHDLGFLMYCSYGNGFRLTHNPLYKKVIVDSADSLSTLFNPTVGTILSWPRMVEQMGWPHNTIMDNMINLEMLFWASKNGGGKDMYDIAVSHAEKTMKYNFREDGTSYHVAVYDTLTGDFIKGVTHQGYSDNSMWARGQAWGIYGFTMCYRESGKKEFRDFAERIADVYLERLPEDYIPYWDFDAPDGEEFRDASASAIVASALLELSQYVSEKKAKEYVGAALKMLKSLSSEKYQSRKTNCAFLLHSVGHHPAGSEIDASIVYADYYYIEALLRLEHLIEKGKI